MITKNVYVEVKKLCSFSFKNIEPPAKISKLRIILLTNFGRQNLMYFHINATAQITTHIDLNKYIFSVFE
jgi:hypothetical protein